MNLVRRPSQGWLFGLELQWNIHIPWEKKTWPYFSILSLAVRLLLPNIYNYMNASGNMKWIPDDLTNWKCLHHLINKGCPAPFLNSSTNRLSIYIYIYISVQRHTPRDIDNNIGGN